MQMVLNEKREAFEGLTEWIGKRCSFMKPNLWTLLGLAFAIAAVLSILLQRNLLLAFAFIFLSGLADVIDGAVAKYAKNQTKFGAILDHAVDKYIEGLLILGIGIYAGELLLAAVALFGSILVGTIDAKGGEVFGKREGKVKLFGRAERMLLLMVSVLAAAFFESGALVAGLMLVAIFSHATALVLLYGYAKSFNNDEA